LTFVDVLNFSDNLSGYFDWREKFLSGFQEMLLSNKLLGGLWGVVIAYLATIGALNPASLMFSLWAVTGAYGGFLFMVCLGYGLVEVPRRLFYEASPEFRLSKLYVLLYEAEEERVDVVERLFDCYRAVRAYEKRLKREDVDEVANFWRAVASIKEELPRELFTYREKRRYEEFRSRAKSLPIRLKELIRVREQVLLSVAEYMRLYSRMDHLYNRISSLKDSSSAEAYSFRNDLLLRSLGGICIVLSAIVFLTEVLLGLALAQAVSLPTLFVGSAGDNIYLRGLYSAVFLLYICICSFYSVFHLNLGRTYRICAHGSSQWYSLLRNSEYVSRISLFVAVNFILLINDSSSKFLAVWSNVDTYMIPIFGTLYHRYIPLTLIVFTPAAALGIFIRITYFDKMGYHRREPHLVNREDIDHGKHTFNKEQDRRRNVMLSSDNELTRISEATEASTSTTASAMLSTGALSADFSGERTQSNMSERMMMRLLGQRLH
jgi:hypothetical protein